MRAVLLGVTMLLASGVAFGQEEDEREERPEPKRSIRVLQHPYDIASFYRSHQGESYFGYDGPPHYEGAERYPIAGFYRSRQAPHPYGYSRFWQSGYSSRGRGGLVVGYRRRIGQNGDLFLLAPTLLAPVGPLTGAFFDGR
jgi:hypothetical protein